MKIKDIIDKILKGEDLTDAENTFMKDYKEPEPDKDKIPKSRLDQEIKKRKDAEGKAEELQQQLEEKENQDLSESEKTQKEVEKLKERLSSVEQERDNANKAKADLEFMSSVSKLAKAHNFDDENYLEYLIKQKDVDLTDEDNAKSFMESLKESNAKHFKVDVNTGGADSSVGKSGEPKSNDQSRLDELNKKEELTIREAGEVAELVEKLKPENKEL